MNLCIKKVTEDLEALSFNTAISSLMVYSQYLNAKDELPTLMFKNMILLLAPFAPHLAEELFESLGGKGSIAFEPWPKFDESKLEEDSVKIAIQVNGKLRSVLEIKKDEDEDVVKTLAMSDGKVKNYIEGKSIVKVIVVKNKIVNLIVK